MDGNFFGTNGVWYLIGAAFVFFMQAGFAMVKPVLQEQRMQVILL